MASNDTYGFAVARLKAMENARLDETFFTRLVECTSIDSAVKALGETSYAPAFVELKSPADFDGAIDAALACSYREVLSFVPDKQLVTLCRLIYDVHNVKIVMKGAMMAEEGARRRLDLLTPLGSMDTDKMVLDLEGGEWGEMPYGLARWCREAQNNWDQHHDLRLVENLIDRGYYEALVRIAQSLDMDVVTRWVKACIDGSNVKSLLRLSRLQFDVGTAETYLFQGGNIDPARLRAMLSEPVENWARSLSFSSLGSLLAPFQEVDDFNGALVRFERDLDDYISSVLAPSRYDAFEPANVVRYLWGREVETKNLRIVLVAVANGVDRGVIRGLLRHV